MEREEGETERMKVRHLQPCSATREAYPMQVGVRDLNLGPSTL